eukprot:108797-Pleurochrysis_carterae.AAC.1
MRLAAVFSNAARSNVLISVALNARVGGRRFLVGNAQRAAAPLYEALVVASRKAVEVALGALLQHTARAWCMLLTHQRPALGALNEVLGAFNFAVLAVGALNAARSDSQRSARLTLLTQRREGALSVSTR